MRPDTTKAPADELSIIICTHTLERWQDLCKSIDSARAQEPPAKEIILVCDHNTELENRAKAAFPDVAVLANREQEGLSGARNTGIAAASGEIVAFLDDDARAEKNWAGHLLSEFQNSGVAGVVTTIEPSWVGRRPSWFPSEFLWVVGCSYRGMPKQKQRVRNVLGASCAFRRYLFQQAGGFNHRLGRTKSKVPLGSEETEFCIRAQQLISDAAFVWLPEAVAYHNVPAKRLTWNYFTLRCYAEGLSKAYLTGLVGPKSGLSTERSYALLTLPAGVARGIGDAALRFDVSGLGRAAAILWGLACACAGYARGRLETFAGDRSERKQQNSRGPKLKHEKT